MGGENVTLGRYSVGGVDLPASAMITSGDGITLQKNLVRAVESDDWEVEGDGRAVPTELVLTMTIEADTESGASAQAMIYWGLLSGATQLNRDDRTYRRLLGAKSCVVTHDYGDAKSHTATFTLLAKEAYWRNTSDNNPKLF